MKVCAEELVAARTYCSIITMTDSRIITDAIAIAI